MLVRLLFEPPLFGYYLVPAGVCAIVWCERNARPIGLRTVTVSALCAFCMPHTFPQPVFFAMLAFGLGYACGPMIASLVPVREALADGGENPGAHDPLLRPRGFDRAARAAG
jgi:hypothetical protein